MLNIHNFFEGGGAGGGVGVKFSVSSFSDMVSLLVFHSLHKLGARLFNLLDLQSNASSVVSAIYNGPDHL